FFLSGSFAGIEGTFKKSDFNRATLRANIDHQATDRLRFELNMNLGRSKTFGRYGQNTATGGTNGIQSPWHGGVTTSVTIPIYNEDGTYNQDIPAVDYNQIQLLDVEERWTRRLETVGNLSAIYDITDKVKIRSRWGINYRNLKDYRYRNPVVDKWAERGGYVENKNYDVTTWNTDQVVDYVETFDDVHNVHGLLGLEFQSMYRSYFRARGRQLPAANYFKTIDATSVNNSMGGTYHEYKKAGAFTRITYNYDQKYYATANLRYDGSS